MSEFLPVKICGMPALVRVEHFLDVKGSFSHNAPSDMDYRGYVEVGFTVCDHRGRPAPWLERKLSKDAYADLESEVIAKMRDTLEEG